MSTTGIKKEELFATSDEKRQAERYKELVEAEAKIQAELEKEMQEREELRRERAKNRAKRSASTSSFSSVSVLPGFSYGIGPDEIPAEGEDSVIKYHNWNEFQDRLNDLEEEKARLRQEAREARADGLQTVKNPYATYPAESMKNLAYIVGLKNRGISYNPEFCILQNIKCKH
jgi:predicted nuclease with TOPRIM domain